MLALLTIVAVSHLHGGGLSVALPAGWDGRIFLDRGQPTLRAHGAGISLRLDELGNRPGRRGFLPTRRVLLRRRDLRGPRLAMRRLAVYGRSFLVTATFAGRSRLAGANRVLARVRISPPAGLSPAARKRLQRPVRLPRLRPGARCPTSRASRAAPHVAVTLGRGPAYPVLGLGAVASLGEDVRVNGRWAHKTLWAVSPRYRGALLIRGRRIDGRGALRFSDSPVRPQMWWRGLWPGQRSQWRYRPSTTLIPGAGCYLFQVDGTTFSRRIVFSAR